MLGATAIVATGLSVSKPAMSSDHQDSPSVKAAGEAASDINDVYSWMDGDKFVLVMTVFPFADATAKFSDATQYVFHLTSGTKFGDTVASTNVICTFDAAQKASCWVGTDDYVTGDASAETGMTSASGKTKVFTGRRGDPFFFNLTGFNDAVATVDSLMGALSMNAAKCPAVDGAHSAALASLLSGQTSGTGGTGPAKAQADDFKTAQALAITISIDKSLVTKGGPFVSVWGSTNN